MGVSYVIYAEARVGNKWYNICPLRKNEDGRLTILPVAKADHGSEKRQKNSKNVPAHTADSQTLARNFEIALTRMTMLMPDTVSPKST